MAAKRRGKTIGGEKWVRERYGRMWGNPKEVLSAKQKAEREKELAESKRLIEEQAEAQREKRQMQALRVQIGAQSRQAETFKAAWITAEQVKVEEAYCGACQRLIRQEDILLIYQTVNLCTSCNSAVQRAITNGEPIDPGLIRNLCQRIIDSGRKLPEDLERVWYRQKYGVGPLERYTFGEINFMPNAPSGSASNWIVYGRGLPEAEVKVKKKRVIYEPELDGTERRFRE